MLSAFDDPEFVIASVRAGARGYILKSGDTEQVARATRLVAAGTTVIDPKLMPLEQVRELRSQIEQLVRQLVEELDLEAAVA